MLKPVPRAALRSGLVPRHPALRAPDVRASLAQQHRLHASIVSGSLGSWRTEQLRCAEHCHQDAACEYVVCIDDVDDVSNQLAVTRSADWRHWPPETGDSALPSWRRALSVPSFSATALFSRMAWAPHSTHLALCLREKQPSGRKCVLYIMRISDGAQKACVLEMGGLQQAASWRMLELVWAPPLPTRRPRLAVVSSNEARPWLCAPTAATQEPLA